MSDKQIMLLPGDLVLLPDGSKVMVNSSHYISLEGRRMFSVCERSGPLFYQDECKLLHRHDYKPYHGIKRCECGEIYTTMADTMLPYEPVTWQ